MNTLENKIGLLVEQFTLEEVLEECGLTPQEALTILFEGGHISLPEWMQDREFEGMYGDETTN